MIRSVRYLSEPHCRGNIISPTCRGSMADLCRRQSVIQKLPRWQAMKTTFTLVFIVAPVLMTESAKKSGSE